MVVKKINKPHYGGIRPTLWFASGLYLINLYLYFPLLSIIWLKIQMQIEVLVQVIVKKISVGWCNSGLIKSHENPENT